jgi:hypothetical protein
MFGGVDLGPDFFAETLEVEDRERRGIFRGSAKNMNNFLGNGTMLFSCSRLEFSVQAIRQFFDIQRSHLFLQNVSIMAEQNARVKYRARRL